MTLTLSSNLFRRPRFNPTNATDFSLATYSTRFTVRDTARFAPPHPTPSLILRLHVPLDTVSYRSRVLTEL